jgi:hypothetical protein
VPVLVPLYQSVGDKDGIVNSQSENKCTYNDVEVIYLQARESHNSQCPYPAEHNRDESNYGKFNPAKREQNYQENQQQRNPDELIKIDL